MGSASLNRRDALIGFPPIEDISGSRQHRAQETELDYGQTSPFDQGNGQPRGSALNLKGAIGCGSRSPETER